MKALHGKKKIGMLLKFLTIIIIFSTMGCRQIVDPLCLYFTISPSSFNDVWTMRYRCGGSYVGVNPRISPDGSKIAFGCTVSGYGDICTVDSDGNNLINITNSKTYDGFPSFSPDGKSIVFMSESNQGLNIYTINSDGTMLKSLTNNNLYKNSPSYSPDGLKILYMREVDRYCIECGCRKTQLFQFNISKNTNIILSTDDISVSGPSYSNDGSKIVYTASYCEKDGNYSYKGLKLLNLSNYQSTVLKSNINVNSVAFSKGSNKVIFSADITSEKSYDLRLYEMDINTLEIRKIFDHDARSPSYINNNKKILFFVQKNRHGGDICTINSDGSSFKVITSTYKLNSH